MTAGDPAQELWVALSADSPPAVHRVPRKLLQASPLLRDLAGFDVAKRNASGRKAAIALDCTKAAWRVVCQFDQPSPCGMLAIEACKVRCAC